MLVALDGIIKKLTGNFSTRSLLAFLFICLLLATITLTSILLITSGNRIVGGVIAETAKTISRDLSGEVTRLLDTPDIVNQNGARSILAGRVDYSNDDSIASFFMDAHQRRAEYSVSSIYFAEPTGRFIGVEVGGHSQGLDAWNISISSEETNRIYTDFEANPDGSVGAKMGEIQPYDPRVRSWYTKALATPERAIWTDIYTDFNTNLATLTRAQAVQDEQGKLIGVLAVDLFLEHIQTFLSTLDMSANSEAFIFNANGWVLAAHAPAYTGAQPSHNLPISDSPFKYMPAAVDIINGGDDQAVTVTINEQEGFLYSAAIGEEHGVDWTLGVYIPNSDFLQSVEEQVLKLAPLALIGLLLIGSALLVFLSVVIRPLEQIRASANKIASGNFNTKIDTSMGNEVGELARSIDTMQQSLKTSFADLVKLAAHDELTQLINRREFERLLALCLQRDRKSVDTDILLYLDLDQFKIVNDTCGHLAGDELLRQVSNIFEQCVLQGDVVARLGGDEFGVLLSHCESPYGMQVAENILDCLEKYRFGWEQHSFRIGVSIGLLLINSESSSVGTVLSNADSACYLAKETGRNRIQQFSENDVAIHERRNEVRWVEEINRAIDHNRFVLYTQRIMPTSIHADDRVHFEVLVRMLDDNGKIIPPSTFFPSAERYNLTSSIDRWVIENTFRWLNANLEFVSSMGVCSINLSAQSIGDTSIADFIMGRLDDYQLPAGQICFEVTETATIANLSSAVSIIDTLRERGCLFALDDFGSSLSSFEHLKNLHVDYLKIDSVFLRDLVGNEYDLAIVTSINKIGQTLGLVTVAEFVENQELVEKIEEIGLDFVQGFGVSRPRPIDELLPIQLKRTG